VWLTLNAISSVARSAITKGVIHHVHSCIQRNSRLQYIYNLAGLHFAPTETSDNLQFFIQWSVYYNHQGGSDRCCEWANFSSMGKLLIQSSLPLQLVNRTWWLIFQWLFQCSRKGRLRQPVGFWLRIGLWFLVHGLIHWPKLGAVNTRIQYLPSLVAFSMVYEVLTHQYYTQITIYCGLQYLWKVLWI
jgi:hypothetical protein